MPRIKVVRRGACRLDVEEPVAMFEEITATITIRPNAATTFVQRRTVMIAAGIVGVLRPI